MTVYRIDMLLNCLWSSQDYHLHHAIGSSTGRELHCPSGSTRTDLLTLWIRISVLS